MVRGFNVIILSLCIMAVGISGAGAQQNPPGNNPNAAQIQRLIHEMQGLRKQLESANSRIQKLMSQANALREKILPIQEKINADSAQIQSLIGK